MDSYEIRLDRKYSKDHVWAQMVSGHTVVGLTAFALDQLGEITVVSIDVKPGDTILAGKAFGTVESVKTLSDLFAPISGKIERVNSDPENRPELLNADCYGQAWLIKIIPADVSEMSTLLNASDYAEFLKTAAH